MSIPVVIRGGGDLASGVALRLHRAGIRVAILELEKPLAVRRTVSFAEAVFSGSVEIEGVRGRKAADANQGEGFAKGGQIPVLVDPDGAQLAALSPTAIIDARMTKKPPVNAFDERALLVGLGPGFVAGENCEAVVETVRGHSLGRVFWEGSAQPDTGVPGTIASYNLDRVLRAPADGNVKAAAEIGDKLREGQMIARVGEAQLKAPFDGVLRGLVHPSLNVHKGMKIGDVDPRNDPSYCWRVSDKALAIGGGVLEALLMRLEIRQQLWS
ncbi:MAG: selenium-dependent molybdenum cofactor biosynthesis protein YqeB [Anaerolineales bacterium]